MNAFSTGTSVTTVVYPETMTMLIGLVDWKLDRDGNKVYAWHNARVRVPGSELPERIASIADLWQIARFLDNRGRITTSSAETARGQLKAYVLMATQLFRQSNSAVLYAA